MAAAALCAGCGRGFRLYYAQSRLLSRTATARCEGTTSSSSSGDEDVATEDEIKHSVLNAALHHVHRYGWSRDALIAGAEEMGLPSVAHGLFPRGGTDLVSHFYQTCNEQLATQMAEQRDAEQQENAMKRKTSRIIRDAVVERLTMIHPYMETWPQAMALMAQPQNATTGWRHLGMLVDDIWHYAGDTAVDMNWYTKRLTLAAVYKSSEIFMLQDKSEEFSDTWTFVDRRLQDVASLGKVSSQVFETGDQLKHGAKAFSILGRNMMGLNSRQR